MSLSNRPFLGVCASTLIWLMFFCVPSFALNHMFAGYAPFTMPKGSIVVFLHGGTKWNSFVPQGEVGKAGKGLVIVQTLKCQPTVYYTIINAGFAGIRLAPLNNGKGGPDFGTFPNPDTRPNAFISVLDWRKDDPNLHPCGILYAMTGYSTLPPLVYRLDASNGTVIGAPVAIQNHPGTSADGFTFLPSTGGDCFLINDRDTSPVYRGYDTITGAPTGLIINMTPLTTVSTGVAYNPQQNLLYFTGRNGGAGGTGGGFLIRTTVTGTFVKSEANPYFFEDISVVNDTGL